MPRFCALSPYPKYAQRRTEAVSIGRWQPAAYLTLCRLHSAVHAQRCAACSMLPALCAVYYPADCTACSVHRRCESFGASATFCSLCRLHGAVHAQRCAACSMLPALRCLLCTACSVVHRPCESFGASAHRVLCSFRPCLANRRGQVAAHSRTKAMNHERTCGRFQVCFLTALQK